MHASMHYVTTVSAILLVTALCSPAAAQVEIVPRGAGEPIVMPQRPLQMKTGTGRIKGRLVSSESGAPVRRAQVRISGADTLPRMATADNDGVYEFRDLPAGRFTVTATKSGYVTVGYGQTRPFEAAKPIELRDGQVMERVDISMPRGSVIAGRIVDEFGEPLADAVVTAMRSTWANGRRQLQPAGREATTNDLGQYRIFGLPPGEYYVSATLRGTREMMMTELALVTAASVGGSSEAPRSGYAPTYYPGTPNGAEAQRVTVGVGQEAQNTDFGLMAVRLVKVSGSVIGSDGRPLEGVMVSARPRNRNEIGFFSTPGGSGRTDRNGTFTLNGVAPGDYTLEASARQVFATTEAGNNAVFTMTRTIVSGSDSDPQSEFGSVPLVVSGDDVPNVMIVTTKGASVSGRVVWEGASRPVTSALRVSAAATDAAGPIAFMGGSAAVNDEGMFEINGLAGHRVFRVVNLPSGWTLKAVRWNGTDITDSGVEIKGATSITGLEIVLSSKTTEVSGSVRAGNEPATDYTVVIFSDDPQKWVTPTSRHVTSARPNQEGRFLVRNLPPGSYYAVALDYIAQGEWNDPDVLDRLKTKASRFSVDEGEVQTLDLPLQGQ